MLDGKSMLVNAGMLPPARPRRRCVGRVGGDDGQRQRPGGRVGDGSVVAFGGSGDQLLRIWRTGEGAVTPVCAAEAPAIPGPLVAVGGRPAARDPAGGQHPRPAPRRRLEGHVAAGQCAAIHAGRFITARELHGDWAGRGRDRELGRRPVAQRCTCRGLRAGLVGVAGLPVHAQRGEGVFARQAPLPTPASTPSLSPRPARSPAASFPRTRPCSASPTVARSCTPRRAARGGRAAAATTRRSPAGPPDQGRVRSRQRGAVERRDVPRRRGAKPGVGRHLVAPAARPGAAADHRPARRRGGLATAGVPRRDHGAAPGES